MTTAFDPVQFGMALRLFVLQKGRAIAESAAANHAKVGALLSEPTSQVVSDIQTVLEGQFLQSNPAVLAGNPTLAQLNIWLNTEWENISAVLASFVPTAAATAPTVVPATPAKPAAPGTPTPAGSPPAAPAPAAS